MAKYFNVFTIVEKEKDERNNWVKIGVAFVNKDKSINVQLDALPVNGMLHIRKPKDKPEGKEGTPF